MNLPCCKTTLKLIWIAFKHLWFVYDIFFDILVGIETIAGIKCGDHNQHTNWQYVLAGLALFILASFGLCLGVHEVYRDFEWFKSKIIKDYEYDYEDEEDAISSGCIYSIRTLIEDIPSLIITCHLRKSVAVVTQIYSIIASIGFIIYSALFINITGCILIRKDGKSQICGVGSCMLGV